MRVVFLPLFPLLPDLKSLSLLRHAAILENVGFGFGSQHTHWPEAWKALKVFQVLRKHLLAASSSSTTSAQFQVGLWACSLLSAAAAVAAVFSWSVGLFGIATPPVMVGGVWTAR